MSQMDFRIKSLYIRVLRGKFDCNRMPLCRNGTDIYTGSTPLWRRMLEKVYKRHSMRKPIKLRNIAKEIGYFDKYHEFKQSINNSVDVPEEVIAIMINASSRMPGCYKWARQFLVKDER